MTKFQEERIYKIFEKLDNNLELKQEFNINLKSMQFDESHRLNAYETYEHCYVLAKKLLKKKHENI
jgi:hypothetical protein